MQYPLSPDVKPEFCTLGTFMRLPVSREGARLAIVGMPFDTAASYRVGARFGPQAIRLASALLFPYNPIQATFPFDETNAIDVGDLSVIPQNIHKSYEIITSALVGLLQHGIAPIGLGGDHSVTLAGLRAVAQIHGPVALIHFDSHTDTWDTYYGEKYWHGSPFIRAQEEGLLAPDKVFQIGIRGSLNDPGDMQSSLDLGFNVFTSAELRRVGMAEVVRQMQIAIGNTPCYLSFDIDFVDPAYAPGTGTPEVGGYSSWETLQIVRSLTGFNFVGYDLVEVLPSYDHAQITALLAATLVYEFASLHAVRLKSEAKKNVLTIAL
jgi:agmatinase